MAGLQSLMQRGTMPGQAGMFSALPTQQGRNPVAFTTSLKQIPPEDLIRIYNDPNDTRPKWAVASAYADAMKAKALQQGMQGQQAMAQNVAAQQKPPVADEVMATYKDGGAIGFTDGGDSFVPPDLIVNPDYDKDGNPRSPAEKDSIIRQNAERIRAYKEAQANKDKGFFERLAPNEPLRQVYEYFQKPSEERKPVLDAVSDFLSDQLKPATTAKAEKGAPAVAPAQGRVRKDETAVLTEKAGRATSAPTVAPTAEPPAERPNAGLGAINVGDIGGFMSRLETASELTDKALRERAKVTPEMQALRDRIAQSRARQLEQSEADIGKIREEGVRQLQGRLDAARRPISEDPEALLALAASINPKRGKVIGSAAEGAAKLLAERRARGEKAEEGITALNEKVRQLNALYQEAQAIEEQRQYAILQNDVEGQRNAEIEAAKNRQQMRQLQATLTATLVEASAKRQAAVTGAYHARTADEANRLAAMGRVENAREEQLRRIEADHMKANAQLYMMGSLPNPPQDIKDKIKKADDELRAKQERAAMSYEQVLGPMRAGIPGLAGLSSIQQGQWGKEVKVTPTPTQ